MPRDRKNNVVGPANFLHWREMNQSFDDMAAISPTFTFTLVGQGDPEEVPAKIVTASLFSVLGVQPAIGRTFTAEEDKPGSRVVVMSDRLWKRRFGGDPAVLRTTVNIEGNPYTVLGVMPPGFSFIDKTVDLWAPVGFSAASRTPRGRSMTVVGRLKADVPVRRAQQDMTRVHAGLARMFPDFNTGWTANVVPLKEQLTGHIPAGIVTSAWRGCARSADCVRKCGQPAACASDRHGSASWRSAPRSARRAHVSCVS